MTNVSSFLNSFDRIQLHELNEYVTRFVAKSVIRPGDVVLDLGANTGWHSAAFAEAVGEAGKVHMFEPNPDLWQILLTIPNSRLWPFAVGDEMSVENFYSPIGFDQVASLHDARDFIGDVPVIVLSVPQITIDSLSEIEIERISFIKMGVERNEEAAFHGMRNLLETVRPIIVFENSTNSIKVFLAMLDYEILPLLGNVIENFSLANVIAVPVERLEEVSGLMPSPITIIGIAFDLENNFASRSVNYQRVLTVA